MSKAQELLRFRYNNYYASELKDLHNYYNNLWKFIIDTNILMIASFRILFNPFFSV